MPNQKITYVEMLTAETDVLYTVKEIAKILKVNVDYVYKLRKTGLLPFIKMGQYKCRKSSLEKFLQDYEGKDITNPEYVRDLEEGK